MKRFLLPFVFTTLVFAQRVPLGPYGNIPVNITDNSIAGTTSLTLVSGNMYGILTVVPTNGTTYTTPTATVLCSMFPFIGNNINWSYDWWVRNASLGANTATLAGGSGVTLVGTGTAAQNFVRHFKINFRSCSTPAVQLISLETTAF